MTPTVLLHGGGFDRRCWDLLLPHLSGPALAVDLPGRGAHPVPLRSVGLDDCAASVRADVDAAGFDEVVLVGHSLAGCCLPAVAGRLAGRVKHVIFIGATVPPNGRSSFDTLDSEIQEMIRSSGDIEPRPMDPAMAAVVLGNDLTEEQSAWCVEGLVAEAPRLITEPVDLSPLSGVLCTWVRTLRDVVVPADKQLAFARQLEGCNVVDLDAGHMCMVSQPTATASVINRIARVAAREGC